MSGRDRSQASHEEAERRGPHGEPAEPAEPDGPAQGADDASRPRKDARAEEARRRRRRAAIFGDVLPEGSVDERGDAWGDRDPHSDDWLRRQVPPHHG